MKIGKIFHKIAILFAVPYYAVKILFKIILVLARSKKSDLETDKL